MRRGTFFSGCATVAAMLMLTGCDFAVRIHDAPPVVAKKTPAPKPVVTAPPAPVDPLGERPALAPPKSFAPQAPVVFEVAGVKVWLVERPELPLVSAAFVVPSGAASDPADKPGLAQLTADMMDEGAGKLDAVRLSTAVADLGATLSVSASADATFASASSLKSHFDDVFAILCDVVARPKLEQKDFARVTGLWKNALRKRGDDPSSVAMLTAASARFGHSSPYGHPALGLLSKADAIKLEDVRRFWQGAFRPERATLVVTGQISRAEVEALLTKSLADWKAKGEPLSPPVAEPGPEPPRLVLVDRPKAVQSVIVVVRDGVRAGSDESAPLDLVNTALGGSFTSRLNENLREDKGWTYGAGSTFTNTRGPGLFYARTSVDAKFTGPAIKEILKELSGMAESGLTQEELDKTKAQDRADLVSTFETTAGTNSELASLAALGLPPSYDVSAAARRQSASLGDLAKLAREHVDPAKATIVVVGDAASVEPQLVEAGLGAPARWTVEGIPAGAKGDASSPPKKAEGAATPKKTSVAAPKKADAKKK